MEVTIEQYLEAKKITDAYEIQEQYKADKALELMKVDLCEYFKTNEVGGYQIEKVHFTRGLLTHHTGHSIGNYYVEISPEEPYFEGCYSDEKADSEIKAIGDKYGFDLSWSSWVYPK